MIDQMAISLAFTLVTGFSAGKIAESRQTEAKGRDRIASKSKIPKPKSYDERERLLKNRRFETETKHIETRDGDIDHETLRTILKETYPIGWVEDEIRIVESSPKRKPMPAKYGMGGVALASCYRDIDGKSEIVFHVDSRDESKEYVIGTIGHELAHANDWISDDHLTATEGEELRNRIKSRLRSPDRFLSSYVEEINNANEEEELETKAIEYWAEICEQYFDDATKLSVEDFNIVDGHIKKTDRLFGWLGAKERRYRLAGIKIEPPQNYR